MIEEKREEEQNLKYFSLSLRIFFLLQNNFLYEFYLSQKFLLVSRKFSLELKNTFLVDFPSNMKDYLVLHTFYQIFFLVKTGLFSAYIGICSPHIGNMSAYKGSNLRTYRHDLRI